MKRFTFVAAPWGIELEVRSTTEKEAHNKAWNLLSPRHKDLCESLECVAIDVPLENVV